MKKILVCGYFANWKKSYDGQTIKTLSIYEELKRRFGEANVIALDTYLLRHNPIRFLWRTVRCTKSVGNVIILPAQRGVKFLIPVFNRINANKRFRIHYILIGGWLPNLLAKSNRLKKEILKLNHIYVENTQTLCQLNKMGITNVLKMTNFKNMLISKKEYNVNFRNIKCCIFSRIEEQKGISDAVNVINSINNSNDNKIYLDIYGSVNSKYKKTFFQMIQNNKYIKYCGIVDYNSSVSTIEKYNLLLFPTKYYTEGVPGTVIDAYFSGVPVLASKWENCEDIIINNKTGIVYAFGDLCDFREKLMDIIHKKYDLKKMSNYCKQKSKCFLPDSALNILYKNL